MLHLPTTIEAIFGAVLVLGLSEGHENRFPVRRLPAALYCLHTSRLTEDGACNVTSVLSAFPCLPELPTLPPKCRYFDRKPPVISGCPENQTLQVELGQTSLKVDWTEPSVADHCETVTLTSKTHVPGDMFPVGETLVMYTFSDSCMNDSHGICQFSINIVTEDTTPPVISSCPANQSLELDVGKMSTTVLWNEPSATDISGTTRIQSRSHVPGDQFDLGRTNVTYLFSDDSGNTATCQFHITIMNPVSSGNSVVISTVTLATSIAILALLWWCKKRKVRQEKQPSALPGLELSQQGVILQTYNIKN